MLFFVVWIFLNYFLFKNIFQDYYQSAKLFAKVISRRQKSLLAGKESRGMDTFSGEVTSKKESTLKGKNLLPEGILE